MAKVKLMLSIALLLGLTSMVGATYVYKTKHPSNQDRFQRLNDDNG